ncbi:MAG: rhomboid family intramembrane serine protease, partial [Polyangia bacterium]|nr:rhomboid family intramembrane serine protease [Polyangia bacterium]
MSNDTIFRMLLWAVVLNAALLLLLMWRRGLQGQRGYALLIGADLLLSVALLAANLHDHPLAMVAVGAFVFLAVVPGLLRGVAAWAARRGRWGLAMRITGLRELLQPGAGIGREKQLLAFLQRVQAGDTEAFLRRLKEEAVANQDPELQAMLHEQILTLLALERRWEEAEAWADERVTPGMVAARPRLGSALIRAYGERGRMDAVIRVMYLVEGGPGAREPENAEVVEHCRIMVLAFTGHAEVLEGLLGRTAPGPLQAKVQAFWRGVAWHQAGDVGRAREWFQKAEELLGPEDVRAREALTARRTQLLSGASPVALPDPEQARRLVEAIEDRARTQPDRPAIRPAGLRRTPVTLLLVAVNLLAYGLVYWTGQEADSNRRLIQAGASLTGAVNAGEYWRLASAMFLHAGLFHLVLNSFMLWFLGRFAEQLLGSIRFFAVYFGAGVLGNLASHLYRDYPVSVGASSSIFGVLGATLAVLVLSRGKVPESWRRFRMFSRVLVIGLSFLPGLDVKQIDNYAHLGGLAGG